MKQSRGIVNGATVVFAILVLFAGTVDADPGAAQQAAQSGPNVLVIDTASPSRPYDPMIFGGFLEHFDNQIYGGVFDPGSPLADEAGFRTDVLDALRELKMPVIRWPGGCFVDAYHWQKGVGKTREPYGDFRWGVIEPNTFAASFLNACLRHSGTVRMANIAPLVNTRGPIFAHAMGIVKRDPGRKLSKHLKIATRLKQNPEKIQEDE